MGSSGRSSGGGGSATDYPVYQKNIQANWLAGMNTHEDISGRVQLDYGNDITSLVNLAVDANAYTGKAAYNPDDQVVGLMGAAHVHLPRLRDQIIAYKYYLDSIITKFEADYSTAGYAADTSLDGLAALPDEIAALVNVTVDVDVNELRFENSLDYAMGYVKSMDTTEHIEAQLGQFDATMRDINAVHSSAFIIGRKIVASGLLETKARLQTDLAKAMTDKTQSVVQMEFQNQQDEFKKYDADLRRHQLIADIKQKSAQLLDNKARSLLVAESEKAKISADLASGAHSSMFNQVAGNVTESSKLIMEARRMALIAYKEQSEENLRITSKEALWSIEAFQGAANVMAAIAGGTVTSTEDSPGKSQSALAGGLSGAAAGAAMGSAVPGIGTVAGAGIGAVMGIMGSRL